MFLISTMEDFSDPSWIVNHIQSRQV